MRLTSFFRRRRYCCWAQVASVCVVAVRTYVKNQNDTNLHVNKSKYPMKLLKWALPLARAATLFLPKEQIDYKYVLIRSGLKTHESAPFSVRYSTERFFHTHKP